MFERDYLMRLIAQTAKMFGVIVGLREQKKQEQAIGQIDEFLARELRMRTRMALGLSDADLLSMLSVGGVPNAESVAVLAAFLQEEAELLTDLGRTGESVPRFAKALRLNLHLLLEQGGFDGWDVEERIRRLLASLSPYEWDNETKRAAWAYFEFAGEFALAENLLYELREASAVTHQEGLSFYDRISRASDESLLAGNLPRAEVEEGRKHWEQAKESVG